MKIKLLYKLPVSIWFFATYAYALPNGPLPDANFEKKIHSIEFYKEGWSFSYPILEDGDEKSLLLKFDYLDDNLNNLNYEIIYCDADWTPSRLAFTEYMNGFQQNPLYPERNSISTAIPYQHYKLNIPNENVTLKLPGNYALVIYGENDEKPLFIKRFMITQTYIQINANAHRPVIPKYQNNFQEVDFTIFHQNFPIENPFQTLKTVIVKNNQWNNAIVDLKPLFIRNNELEYNYEDKNLFEGGNEFRAFDTKSLKYNNINIDNIYSKNNIYEVDLKQDKSRANLPYLSQEDLNGKFLIQNTEGIEPDFDAEYVWVNFKLHSVEEIENAEVYVSGAFTDNNLYEDYKMNYNPEKSEYSLKALLKQGYYNYQYIVKLDNGNIDDTYFEGSYYETENDYIIYVYYRPFGQKYDALIGTKIINSIKYN